MNNTVFLVGRLTSDLEIKEVNEKKYAIMNIATTRNFKNEEGIYETDFFNVTLYNVIAQNVIEYCHKDNLVGIKGRLQTNVIEKENGTKENKLEIIAEKVSFLTSYNK